MKYGNIKKKINTVVFLQSWYIFWNASSVVLLWWIRYTRTAQRFLCIIFCFTCKHKPTTSVPFWTLYRILDAVGQNYPTLSRQHTNADTPEHTTTTLGPGSKVVNPPRHRRVSRHLALEACRKGRGGGVLLLHLYEMIILVNILYLMIKLGLCYSSCLGCQSYYSINFDIFLSNRRIIVFVVVCRFYLSQTKNMFRMKS